MRTPVLTACLSLSLIACAGTISGQGDDGGDDGDDGAGGAVCGNNVKEGAEACDDGNTTSGDGCSATCTTEAAPKLGVTLDKQTVNTELFSTNMITVTLTSTGGFAGSVGLAASVVDTAGVAIPGWTITMPATVDLAANGTQTAVATLKLPSTGALAGTVKIDATTTLGVEHIESTVAVQKQITFTVNFNAGANQCVYPTDAVGNVNVQQGTKIRFLDNDATANMIFHIDDNAGSIAGLTHQGNGGTAAGTAYEQTVGAATGTAKWYCHNRNDPGNLRLTAVP